MARHDSGRSGPIPKTGLIRFSPFDVTPVRSWKQKHDHIGMCVALTSIVLGQPTYMTTFWALSSGSSLSEILNSNLEARLQTSSLSALLLRTQFKSADPLCFTSFLPSMNPTGHQSELVCSAPSQLSLPTLAL